MNPTLNTPAGSLMAGRVYVICDENFGPRLAALGSEIPVWIIRSKINNAAVSAARQSGRSNITSFEAEPFVDLIETVVLHHPSWSQLVVYGESYDEAVAAVEGLNVHLEKIAAGSICRRLIENAAV